MRTGLAELGVSIVVSDDDDGSYVLELTLRDEKSDDDRCVEARSSVSR